MQKCRWCLIRGGGAGFDEGSDNKVLGMAQSLILSTWYRLRLGAWKLGMMGAEAQR